MGWIGLELGCAVREEAQLAAHELERSGTGWLLLPRHEQGTDAALPERGDNGDGGSDVLKRNGDVYEREHGKGSTCAQKWRRKVACAHSELARMSVAGEEREKLDGDDFLLRSSIIRAGRESRARRSCWWP